MYLSDLIFSIYLHDYKYLTLVLHKAVVLAVYKVQEKSHFLSFCTDCWLTTIVLWSYYFMSMETNVINPASIIFSKSNMVAFWNNGYSFNFYSLADLKSMRICDFEVVTEKHRYLLSIPGPWKCSEGKAHSTGQGAQLRWQASWRCQAGMAAADNLNTEEAEPPAQLDCLNRWALSSHERPCSISRWRAIEKETQYQPLTSTGMNTHVHVHSKHMHLI